MPKIGNTGASAPSVKSKKQKNKKPQRVSTDTIAAIQNLHSMVEKAEVHLKKMPGSREPDCKVEVGSVLWHPDYNDDSESFQLVFEDDSIKVRRTEHDHQFDRETHSLSSLDEYDTSTRIALARFIPDLIVSAKKSEQRVRTAADDAAAMIEMAIAETMEVVNE